MCICSDYTFTNKYISTHVAIIAIKWGIAHKILTHVIYIIYYFILTA